MIGCGLALNDTRFILVQATGPTSSLSQSMTIPKPRCLKFVVGLQTEGSKMGSVRGPVGLQTKGPRVTGASTCAKYSSMHSV